MGRVNGVLTVNTSRIANEATVPILFMDSSWVGLPINGFLYRFLDKAQSTFLD